MRFGIVKPEKSARRADKNGDQEGGVLLAIEERDYADLEGSLNYQFRNIDWLKRALTHRSAPQDGEKNDYERLEFLGDAVFDLVIADLLSKEHPEAREGELSKMRAALVNTVSLSEMARKINLGSYIKLGRGEIASGGGDRSSILADVLEAVLGAIYCDTGFPAAFEAVVNLFGDAIKTVTPSDPKTELQEILHSLGSEAPTYLLECVEGPEHSPTFVSIVQVDGEVVGRGKGSTKKASQQAAAEEALFKLKPGDEIDKAVVDATSGESGDDKENVASVDFSQELKDD